MHFNEQENKESEVNDKNEITAMISTRKPLEVDIVCFIHHINYKLAIIQPFFQEFKEGSKNIVFTIASVKAARSARCK